MVNKEYVARKKKSEEVAGKIRDLVEGVLIVGSVAYNPDAVTADSDLDLVVVLDFSSVDFKELYKRLGQKFEPLLVKYASEGVINNVSIVWDEEFEIGLHLWDKGAFDNVINLRSYNLIFRRENFGRNFKSTSDRETLVNLKGEKKEVFKDPRKVEGGSILKFFVYWKDDSGFYPGIQINNLLMDPKILYEKDGLITRGLRNFNINLQEKLREVYGVDEQADLCNALGVVLRNKITRELRERLRNFLVTKLL
jgi:predicted nucleotidyltransferase